VIMGDGYSTDSGKSHEVFWKTVADLQTGRVGGVARIRKGWRTENEER
jgi:hypothetical protein